MCSQTSTNLDYSDYPLEDLDLSDFSNSGDALSASCACCDYIYVKDDVFVLPEEMIQNSYHPNSSQCCSTGQNFHSEFAAGITIDATQGKIYLKTRVKAFDSTGDSGYFGNVSLSSDVYDKAKCDAFDAMMSRWNGAVKKIVISTDKCEKTFDLSFNVTEDDENPHYEINFINATFDPDGRSAVRMEDKKVKLNFGDARSVLGSDNAGLLEAHEYGHMLGLPDEYDELIDYNADSDGDDYRFRSFDPRDERSLRIEVDEYSQTNIEEADRLFGLEPGIDIGESTGDWLTDSQGRMYLPGRFWYVEFERDIGGAQYNWPSYTPYGLVTSGDNQGHMGTMVEDTPKRPEYLLPIVYAVAEIMKENGENVLEITLK